MKAAKRGRLQKLDLWASLLLFLGEIVNIETVDAPTFKGDIMKRERGIYLTRLKELVEASSKPTLPNFSNFLEILCGGTLCQKCSFCHSPITVNALAWYGKGYKLGVVPVIHHEPDFEPLFCCRRRDCVTELDNTFTERVILNQNVGGILDKLGAWRCDYCFLLARKVHR